MWQLGMLRFYKSLNYWIRIEHQYWLCVAQASVSNLAMGPRTQRATRRGPGALIDLETCFRTWWYRMTRNKFNDSSTDEESDDSHEARVCRNHRPLEKGKLVCLPKSRFHYFRNQNLTFSWFLDFMISCLQVGRGQRFLSGSWVSRFLGFQVFYACRYRILYVSTSARSDINRETRLQFVQFHVQKEKRQKTKHPTWRSQKIPTRSQTEFVKEQGTTDWAVLYGHVPEAAKWEDYYKPSERHGGREKVSGISWLEKPSRRPQTNSGHGRVYLWSLSAENCFGTGFLGSYRESEILVGILYRMLFEIRFGIQGSLGCLHFT